LTISYWYRYNSFLLDKKLTHKPLNFDEIDREIALKKSERTLLVPKIDAALVELYEKIKGNGGGVGAALLIGNTCDGCRLAINAVEMERIKSLDSEEVLRCEECRRILVRI
jgi:predicted  nucleic acid-binding Zn-ribbon protein